MDLCHCVEPIIETNERGAQHCIKCKLWYDPKEWKRDPRRLRAERDALIEARETEQFVNDIISGRKKV